MKQQQPLYGSGKKPAKQKLPFKQGLRTSAKGSKKAKPIYGRMKK